MQKDYLFGMIKFESVGDISILSLFGLPLYEKVGNVRGLLGFVWTVKN